jgi:hypothetical protein
MRSMAVMALAIVLADGTSTAFAEEQPHASPPVDIVRVVGREPSRHSRFLRTARHWQPEATTIRSSSGMPPLVSCCARLKGIRTESWR